MQGRNRDADIENGLHIGWEGEDGMNWESSIDIYTLPCVKQIAGGTCCIAQGAHLDGWDGGGGREAQERGDICIHKAD